MAQKIRNFNDLESILESTKSFGDKEQDNHAILSGDNSKDPASSRADLWSYFIDTVGAYSGNKEERKPYFIAGILFRLLTNLILTVFQMSMSSTAF